MTTLRDALATSIVDGRLSSTELDSLIDSGKNPNGSASADLKQVLTRYSDALDPAAQQKLAAVAVSLGIAVPQATDLTTNPALAGVASGAKTLSAAGNSSGLSVELVQRALMRLSMQQGHANFSLPRYGADGDFGAETTRAVKAFQGAVGLTVNGVVNAETIKALDQAFSTPGPTSALSHPRFKASPELAAVLAGTALGRGANGAGVLAVQQALVDLGYAFPKAGADGDFGGETLDALNEFQADHGLARTGRIDAATVRKLDEVATAPGVEAVRSPEYSKMVKNGVMTAMLGIGYDEDGSDLWVRTNVQNELASAGFQPFNVANKTDAELRALGIDPAGVDKLGTYYLADKGKVGGKPAKILLKYVDRYTPDAKERWALGFATSAFVEYAGHARYGSGPDFDPKDSVAGNFVITDPYDQHMRDILKNHGHDIDKVMMTNDYQMMFFSGCKTRDYLPGLRAVKNKTGANLDTVTSNDLLLWSNVGDNVMRMLRGVMAGKTINDMRAELKAANNGVDFTADGFGGNKG